MSNITIGIGAEFKGRKAFKDAEKSTSALEKGVKKLGKQLAGVFAVQQVTAFAKASIKAFAEEEKSAAMLANTMKNLGMAFATPQLETFISQLSQTAGVADDVLRPAMQKLINQTGDYFKSQELLTKAIEISRGSGIELGIVVQDLANAYVGNNRGLRKYNLGLSQAELKTLSFADAQQKLTDKFKGSNAAYLNTYAGKMEVLKTAAGEAQETIGKGLVDALMAIGNDTSVQELADSMLAFADSLSDAIYGIGSLIGEFKKLNSATPDWLKKLFGELAMPGALGAAAKIYGEVRQYGDFKQNQKLENPSVQMFMTDMANMRLNRQKFETDKDLLLLEKKRLAEEKKRLAEQKKQALLKKQAALFDLEKIGLVAALQGKITEEERLRLNLQLALLTGNDELAKKLSAELANSIDKTGKLAKDLTTLPDAKNPFASWKAYLDQIEEQARRIANISGSGTVSAGSSASLFSSEALSTPYGGYSTAGIYENNVWVTVQGSVVSDQDLEQMVLNGLQGRSLSGSPSVIGRISGMFG